MPWFDPQPLPEQLLYWGIIGQKHLVSKWPQPNNPRVNSWFRMYATVGNFPMPGRVPFQWQSFSQDPPNPPPVINRWGWVQMEAIAPMHVRGLSGLDPVTGAEMEVNIEYFDSMPVSGFRGVELKHTVSIGAEFSVRSYEFRDVPPNVFKWDYNQFQSEPVTFLNFGTDSAGWPYASTAIQSCAVSDCYDFPPPPTGPNPGYAVFNDVDAYIALTNNTPSIAGRWRIQADVRYHSLPQNWILCHSNLVNNIAGTGDPNAWYRSNNGPINPQFPLDVWLNFSFEREWRVPTGNRFQLFINDQERANFGGVNFALVFNRLGGDRGTVPRQFGDFDMRNLLVQTNNAGMLNTILDMPLINNACDEGPLANHGTAFNMGLPSCGV